MTRLIGIGLLFVFLFACGKKEEEQPSEIIPKDEMINLLVDMYALEAKFSHNQIIDHRTYKTGVKGFEDLFKKYKTTKEIVEKSIDYYVRQPLVMKEIQSQVLDSLNSRSRK
jgi:hypothetical protein